MTTPAAYGTCPLDVAEELYPPYAKKFSKTKFSDINGDEVPGILLDCPIRRAVPVFPKTTLFAKTGQLESPWRLITGGGDADVLVKLVHNETSKLRLLKLVPL